MGLLMYLKSIIIVMLQTLPHVNNFYLPEESC